MRLSLIATFFLAAALPAAAQSTPQTLQSYQQATRDACPGLWERTKSSPDFDETAYSESECTCLADKITTPTWSDETQDWTGPLMSEDDAAAVANAVKNESTVDDVLYSLTENMSEDGFTVIASCYFKDSEGGDSSEAAPAASNNNRPGHNIAAPVASDPAPATQTAAPPDASQNEPVPAALTDYQTQAQALCPAISANSTTTDTSGYFTCECAASAITSRAWSDDDYAYSGPYMTETDARLIVDSLKASSNMAQASNAIYSGLSEDGQSVMSSCFSK